MTNIRKTLHSNASRRAFLKSLSAAGAAFPLSHLSPFAMAPGISPQTLQNPITQAQLAADSLRPQYHLLPARNWMNDPDGPIFWNDNYHMFYQYNPNAAVWGDMHWGHAVSPDMVHWKHLPVALAPTPGGPDQDGCFTGSAVIQANGQESVATFLYTGVKSVAPAEATLRDGNHNFLETQCLATSTDPQLLVWQKQEAAVLLPPHNPKLTGFRDPFLWRDANIWYMGIGSGESGKGGCVLLYRSTDLRQWEYLHPLVSGERNTKTTTDPVDSGEMWECPDLFAMGKKHLLIYSTEHKVYWQSGELDPKELVFHPQKSGLLDYGNLYAPKSQLAPDNRRILWGWIPEMRPEKEFSAAGWAGCTSLPRTLTLDTDGNLNMEFARELIALRAQQTLISTTLAYSSVREEVYLAGPTTECLLRFSSKPWEFRVTCKDVPFFSAAYDPQNKGQELKLAGASVPLPPRASGDHELRLFLDASVIEIVADNSISFTTRVYRSPNFPLNFSLVDKSGSKTAPAHLSVWSLKSISLNRLTI